MKKTRIPKDLITSTQVKDLMGLSNTTAVYCLRNRGLLRAYPAPKNAPSAHAGAGRKPAVWFSHAEVLDYLLTCREKTVREVKKPGRLKVEAVAPSPPVQEKPVQRVEVEIRAVSARKLRFLRRGLLRRRVRSVDASVRQVPCQVEVTPRYIRI